MTESLFEQLRTYVLWSDADDAALTRLHALARPELPRIADRFYDRILGHPQARVVLERGESSLGRLRGTLQHWLDRLLGGPRDAEYVASRVRIGRVHVRIGLPQHFMLGAMNLVRDELERLVEDAGLEAGERRALRTSLGRALDVDLALMLESWRQALLEQQTRAERMAALGQVAGFLAHELRNPLAVIDAALYLLRGRSAGDEKARALVERIGRQTAQADRIIASVLGLVRDGPLRREKLRAGALVETAAAGVSRPEEVALQLEGLDALPEVDGDAGQLGLAFTNLVKNAVQAAAPAGWVRLAGTAEPGAERLQIVVEDSGPGVAPDFRARLFEPLATTRPHGTGLGLALVRRIVERHGGTVTHEPADGAGARFVVRLPVAGAPPLAATLPPGVR